MSEDREWEPRRSFEDEDIWVSTRTGQRMTVTATATATGSALTEEQIVACAGFTLDEVKALYRRGDR